MWVLDNTKVMLKVALATALLEDEKKIKIKMVIKGTLDGLFNRSGKLK